MSKPFRAKFAGTCPTCGEEIKAGAQAQMVSGAAHHYPGCSRHAEAKGAIERGETFASQKPSDYRRGSSPSSTRPRR